jgi:hypothetical protein
MASVFDQIAMALVALRQYTLSLPASSLERQMLLAKLREYEAAVLFLAAKNSD